MSEISDKIRAAKFTVGEHEIQLAPPASITIRTELVAASQDNAARAKAAALGACWRGKGRPKARYADHGYNPMRYGAAVLEELVARGVAPLQVLAVGGMALSLCFEGVIPGEDEVAAATERFPEDEG